MPMKPLSSPLPPRNHTVKRVPLRAEKPSFNLTADAFIGHWDRVPDSNLIGIRTIDLVQDDKF
jgi:hypothetical protein